MKKSNRDYKSFSLNTDYHKAVEAFRKDYLTKLLESCKGLPGEACKVSGMNRTYLYRLLNQYNIPYIRTYNEKGKKGNWGIYTSKGSCRSLNFQEF